MATLLDLLTQFGDSSLPIPEGALACARPFLDPPAADQEDRQTLVAGITVLPQGYGSLQRPRAIPILDHQNRAQGYLTPALYTGTTEGLTALLAARIWQGLRQWDEQHGWGSDQLAREQAWLPKPRGVEFTEVSQLRQALLAARDLLAIHVQDSEQRRQQLCLLLGLLERLVDAASDDNRAAVCHVCPE
jgi:hypothetical protein